MRRNFTFLVISCVMFFVNPSAHAVGQSSSNYAIPWDIMGSGGGTTGSLIYSITGSLGPVISPPISSSNYTLVSGFQVSPDTDVDSVRDVVDNCLTVPNPDQTASDVDSYGDACDDLPTDPSESLDTDGDGIGNNADSDDDNDGLSDAEEILLGTDPLLFDSDNDGYSDGEEVAAGTDPLDGASYPIPVDGDITLDGVVDIRDLLLGTQVLMGTASLTNEQLVHGDVAPLVAGVPDPDGEFTLGDLLVIQRKVFGLISF